MKVDEAIGLLTKVYNHSCAGFRDELDGKVRDDIAVLIQSLQAENISLKQQIDHIVEVGDSAYERLQAENERLRGQVENMKNCGNCKWFQEEGDCVNPKNTEQDCEYYRGFFWEMED